LERPEPEPVGAKVDPLGDPFGESELPEGFLTLLEPVAMPLVAEPVVPPVWVPLAPMDEPVPTEPPLVEGLPPPETPPAEPPPLVCAIANVLVSASAPANAIVVSFMAIFLC
jgi:hypothetical protein